MGNRLLCIYLPYIEDISRCPIPRIGIMVEAKREKITNVQTTAIFESFIHFYWNLDHCHTRASYPVFWWAAGMANDMGRDGRRSKPVHGR
jgi:hypothetical protein